MKTILLTGASGFLGRTLLKDLSQQHQIITIGRKALPDTTNQIHYRGNFSDLEDLQQLNSHQIDAVIHLAAVTGGCPESEGILVNVEGTRCLMQYLIERDCVKFVNASSTAVVGFQSKDFRPIEIPISDEHPCLDRDGYGMSKYLMEELTKYLCRQNPDIDVTNLRLAAIYPDETPPPRVKPGTATEWALAQITQLPRSTAIKVIKQSVESNIKPGCHIMNLVSPKAWTEGPVINVLRSWWGDEVDLSYYEQPNIDPQASVFSCVTMTREFEI